METFAEARPFVDHPEYSTDRRRTLAGVNPEDIDPPIRGLVARFAELPQCFTLQCCYGHFVPGGLGDLHTLDPAPDHDVGEIQYRIAYLALAQTWRAAAVMATDQQLAQWRATIERMPEPLRAGPYYVLGEAETQHQRWEQAALAYLRTAILYPEHRNLAARALWDDGRSLERLGRSEQAVLLYRELVKTYPASAAASEARARVEEMRGEGTGDRETGR